MDSRKYGRTYHFPFSPGTTSDDRIQYEYWDYIQQMQNLVLTEKLDGENNCLSRFGVFARSHAAPTTSPWTAHLREKWQLIKHDLGELEIFGENIFAIHSIEYTQVEHYYYVFAVRYRDRWLSWEEVCFYAAAFDLPTVPVMQTLNAFEDEQRFRQQVLDLVQEESILQSRDVLSSEPCTVEGLVARNADGFGVPELGRNVFKYVRKGHVKTDEHWTRNWKRTKLWYERKTNDHGKDME